VNTECEGRTLAERIAVFDAESDRGLDRLLYFALEAIVLIDGSKVFLKGGCKCNKIADLIQGKKGQDYVPENMREPANWVPL